MRHTRLHLAHRNILSASKRDFGCWPEAEVMAAALPPSELPRESVGLVQGPLCAIRPYPFLSSNPPRLDERFGSLLRRYQVLGRQRGQQEYG